MALTVTAVRAVFAGIKSTVPGAVVAVVSGSETANGVRTPSAAGAAPDDYGDQGLTTQEVRVDASEMTQPDRGATITVGGETAIVNDVRADQLGALMLISYQFTRPVEGV